MKRIEDFSKLKEGDKVVLFGKHDVTYYRFFSIHPLNDKYVFLINIVTQEAERFSRETLDRFYTDYTKEDIVEFRIKCYEDRIKLLKESMFHKEHEEFNVYRCFRQGAYAGGVILVAARSVQEAFDTLGNCKELNYMTYENEDGELVSDGYPISKWELVPDLHVDAVTPHVILENSYAE